MDYGLSNKVIIVTGGATGIGKAIAQAFHDEGAIVVTNGRDEARLQQALCDIGPRAYGIRADLTKLEDNETLYEYARSFGPIEGLVNNIGIFESKDFFEFDDARWFEYFDSNIMTGVRMCRLVLKDMLARNSGQVCVCDLEAALPVKQPTVSHHLKLLRAAGLIDCERHGLWAHYFIQRDALQALYRRVNGHLQGLVG